MTDTGAAEIHGNTTWTFERVDHLVARWADGHSAGQIAIELGTTRNAIIGKIHRLNLPPRETRSSIRYGYATRHLSREEKAARQLARRAVRLGALSFPLRPKLLPPAPPPVVELQIPPRMVGLLDLKRSDCRFPFGDGPYLFCGTPATDGPYCRAHHEVTHSHPPQTKGAHKLAVLMGTDPARLQPAAAGSSRGSR